MPMIVPDPAAIQHFFESLYGTAENGWLVLNHPDPTRLTRQGKAVLVSDWFDLTCTTWQKVTRTAVQHSRTRDVYYGVVIQRPDCEPEVFKRSRSATAYAVPALYADIDIATGKHAASRLPATDREAL